MNIRLDEDELVRTLQAHEMRHRRKRRAALAGHVVRMQTAAAMAYRDVCLARMGLDSDRADERAWAAEQVEFFQAAQRVFARKARRLLFKLIRDGGKPCSKD